MQSEQGYPSVYRAGPSQPSSSHAPGAAATVQAVKDANGDTVEYKTHFFNPFEVKHRRRTTKSQFRVLEDTFLGEV